MKFLKLICLFLVFATLGFSSLKRGPRYLISVSKNDKALYSFYVDNVEAMNAILESRDINALKLLISLSGAPECCPDPVSLTDSTYVCCDKIIKFERKN